MTWLWWILAIVLGMGEMISAQFVLIWFALGAAGAAIMANFVPFLHQLLTFVGLSFVLTVLSRQIILPKGAAKTNIWALIGKKGVVMETVQKIYCDKGLVKVDGEIWRAFCDEEFIAVGHTVRVLGVDGVKLKVVEYADGDDSRA